MAHIIDQLDDYSGSDVSSLAKMIKSYPMEELIKSKLFHIQDDGTWMPVIVQSDEQLEIECSWEDIPEGTRIYFYSSFLSSFLKKDFIYCTDSF